jgi:hypothetical protein
VLTTFFRSIGNQFLATVEFLSAIDAQQDLDLAQITSASDSAQASGEIHFRAAAKAI